MKTESNSERYLCDRFVKCLELPSEGLDAECRKCILAVNAMYGWLLENDILQKTAFVQLVRKDISYFALSTSDLQKYHTAMLESGCENAETAVHLIFDEPYTPCIYSGAMQLSWTMATYRSNNGVVGRSWEIDMVKRLKSERAQEISDIRIKKGTKAAIEALFRLQQRK